MKKKAETTATTCHGNEGCRYCGYLSRAFTATEKPGKSCPISDGRVDMQYVRHVC